MFWNLYCFFSDERNPVEIVGPTVISKTDFHIFMTTWLLLWWIKICVVVFKVSFRAADIIYVTMLILLSEVSKNFDTDVTMLFFFYGPLSLIYMSLSCHIFHSVNEFLQHAASNLSHWWFCIHNLHIHNFLLNWFF